MTQITALVLRAVAGGYHYGFDVMERCDLPSGTVYPALRRLERAGMLKSRWEEALDAHADGRPRRRTYELTPAGRDALPEAERKLAEVRRVLGALPPAPTGEA
jgi:DNA-binding PadR family transcriptional regulator